jgi:hypothetical protein
MVSVGAVFLNDNLVKKLDMGLHDRNARLSSGESSTSFLIIRCSRRQPPCLSGPKIALFWFFIDPLPS